MGKENSKQYAALQQAARRELADTSQSLTIDSERPGVTMAEMDAAYALILKEIEELEKINDNKIALRPQVVRPGGLSAVSSRPNGSRQAQGRMAQGSKKPSKKGG